MESRSEQQRLEAAKHLEERERQAELALQEGLERQEEREELELQAQLIRQSDLELEKSLAEQPTKDRYSKFRTGTGYVSFGSRSNNSERLALQRTATAAPIVSPTRMVESPPIVKSPSHPVFTGRSRNLQSTTPSLRKNLGDSLRKNQIKMTSHPITFEAAIGKLASLQDIIEKSGASIDLICVLKQIISQLQANGSSLASLRMLRQIFVNPEFKKEIEENSYLQCHISKINDAALDLFALSRMEKSRKLYLAIKDSEFSAMMAKPIDKPKMCPNYLAFQADINDLSDFVMLDIVSNRTKEEAILCIESWILVLQKSIVLKDFNTAFAISGALNTSPVNRLRGTSLREESDFNLSLNAQFIWYQQSEVLEHTNSYKNLREVMVGNAIPYLGIYTSALESLSAQLDSDISEKDKNDLRLKMKESEDEARSFKANIMNEPFSINFNNNQWWSINNEIKKLIRELNSKESSVEDMCFERTKDLIPTIITIDENDLKRIRKERIEEAKKTKTEKAETAKIKAEIEEGKKIKAEIASIASISKLYLKSERNLTHIQQFNQFASDLEKCSYLDGQILKLDEQIQKLKAEYKLMNQEKEKLGKEYKKTAKPQHKLDNEITKKLKKFKSLGGSESNFYMQEEIAKIKSEIQKIRNICKGIDLQRNALKRKMRKVELEIKTCEGDRQNLIANKEQNGFISTKKAGLLSKINLFNKDQELKRISLDVTLQTPVGMPLSRQSSRGTLGASEGKQVRAEVARVIGTEETEDNPKKLTRAATQLMFKEAQQDIEGRLKLMKSKSYSDYGVPVKKI